MTGREVGGAAGGEVVKSAVARHLLGTVEAWREAWKQPEVQPSLFDPDGGGGR